MTLSSLLHRVACGVLLLTAPPSALAQSWRQSAAGIGTTARVLLVGTRPEDEDNALIAWLALGRNVDVAYLSLTRGEAGVNIAGPERQSALGVVRTAELLAERQRDGAHQYFTRAYDVGFTPSDSALEAAWPHDSLLNDVVSVVRAFRPHVVISMFAESERDATRRLAARLAREAFSAAADTTRIRVSATARLPAWTVSRLFTRVDSAVTNGGGAITIDVGEFDRRTGRSYAELGTEIRRLQRTQPAPPAPPVGRIARQLRLDSTRAGAELASLFGNLDTTSMRFRGAVPADAELLVDSVRSDLRDVQALAPSGAPDALAAALARLATRIASARLAYQCPDVSGVPRCSGAAGDLAVSLTAVRERAVRAMIDAAGIVIDGTVAREIVAAGDSVPVTVAVFNGGASPVGIRRLAATGGNLMSLLVRDSTLVRPDSVARWSAYLRVLSPTYHWWQIHGLLEGTAIHDFEVLRPSHVTPELIGGEDRIAASAVEATLVIAGIEVPVIERPLVYRSAATIRGDTRHPLAGVPALSVLFERTAEYERAGLPIDRLFHVYLSSAHTTPDTVTVTLKLPRGLRADSVTRTAIVPPLGARNVFFRLRGTLTPASDTISAAASFAPRASSAPASTTFRIAEAREFKAGTFARDYPHIPSQQYWRSSILRLEAVDLRVPPRLRVAYIKGSDDVQVPLGQLQLNVQALDPSLLSVVDLSVYTTVLIGADALANDALTGAIPSLVAFMRNGGAVVVLPGGDEVARSGLLPFPIAFDSTANRVNDPAAEVWMTDLKSQFLTWPNRITARDFDGWVVERARGVPAAFDTRYRTLLSMGDARQPPMAGTILVAPVGKGRIIYASLSLDRQLAATNPGAARLFVNLLSAGLLPSSR